jgi:hypothetical protein
VARRLGKSTHHNQAAWYVVRWKRRYAPTPATFASAIVAARTPAATERPSQRNAEEPLASIWRRAELADTAERFDSPAVRRAHEDNDRWRMPGIATWMRHAGRMITFNLVVVIIHLAVVRWIFLPIGG